MKEISDNSGHTIQVVNLGEALYKDPYGEYIIGIEGLIGNGIAVYSDYVKNSNVTCTKLISEHKKKEIISIAVKLFESAGIKVELY